MACVADDLYESRRIDVFLDNLGRYLRNEPLNNVVDKRDWH